jgi:hypothetical protein
VDVILMGLNVVVPLFVIMVAGYVTRRVGIINDNGVGAVNRLLFWVFLPAILLVSIYETDLKEVFDVGVILFSAMGTFLVFLVSFFLVPRLEKRRDRCGVIIQGLIRGNEVYFGFPVVVSLIGTAYLGLMSIVVAFAVLVYNGLSIFSLEYFKGETVNKKQLVRNIVTNPLILATALAVFLVFLNISIPGMVLKGLESLSQVASPFALFVLGASFNFTSTKKYLKNVFWVTFLRLFLIPGIVLFVTYQVGFSSPQIVVLFVTFGVPTAVASYSMARELKADYELASQIVVFTSLFSIFSIFVWTVVMQLVGII